ncbi:tetratricopeptide repeat protein [Pararobbsia silviterrae]|uniref:Uncharacterized protein n=1 Tax=Pararobbsia silviterrae TaxID=1792498 RepID=A0A494XZ00_9BURK|nr:tetratricopeptide repeat protein [Pararobbsia silviterrae]RKP55742.1 hypothetical protein D7S86_11000 [Pararobbsia silviterrae]
MSVEQMLDEALVHHKEGRLAQAEPLYRAAIDAEPEHADAILNLTRILMLTSRTEEAKRWLNWRLADAPDDVVAHRQLGFAHASQNEAAQALVSFQTVIELEPTDAGAHEIIAHLLKNVGRVTEAQDNFRRSAALRAPVKFAHAIGNGPAFRVLVLFAPGAGNTPYFYMMRIGTYDCHMLTFVPGIEYDIEALRASTDVVMNLIADFDTAGSQLPHIAPLLEKIGRPVVNHPERILQTGRELMSRRLASIDNCIMPVTRRYTAEQMHDRAYARETPAFTYPLLVRRAGTHGGEDFDKVDDEAALVAFIAQTRAEYYYVTQYVDYRSDDGFFRKYRFMFIDGEILPYHLAIDTQWKIHHATTDMLHQKWMQDEEADFLNNPRHYFKDKHYAALVAIRDSVGLDYWGIDCGIDREGRVVVFEANATMLVHTRFKAFPYKKPAVVRIKRAFDAMLERRAVVAKAAAAKDAAPSSLA